MKWLLMCVGCDMVRITNAGIKSEVGSLVFYLYPMISILPIYFPKLPNLR